MSEFLEIGSGKKLAIIVAIENYRKGEITPVKYAKNDALRFKKMLVDSMGYSEKEIVTLLDHEAVKAAFENDIPYEIKQLTAGDEFIFYYVGHGFYAHGDNKLTCWDSHPFNLSETCISIKDAVFDPLITTGCKHSLIFLDCCSSFLKETLTSRDIIADLDVKELEVFIQPSDYYAVFMSCSPGEKSYSDDTLKQGIWTWHLTDALAGNVELALVRDLFITDRSLQSYLSFAIPKFITEKTVIRATQRPFAKIHASNEFLIRKIPLAVLEIDRSLPDFKLNYAKAIFRKIDYEKIKSAEGFKKNYTIPKWKGAAATKFVREVFLTETQKEIQKIYERTKEVLGLRKDDIQYGAYSEGGSVQCNFFRYDVDVNLDEDNLSQARFTRKLQIRVSRSEIPPEFDSIFPIYLDELIIPIEGDIEFDDIVRKFENLREEQGGSLKDNAIDGIVEYITEGKTSLTIDFNEKELIITHYSPMRSIDLADKSVEDLKRISSHKVALLGKRSS